MHNKLGLFKPNTDYLCSHGVWYFWNNFWDVIDKKFKWVIHAMITTQYFFLFCRLSISTNFTSPRGNTIKPISHKVLHWMESGLCDHPRLRFFLSLLCWVIHPQWTTFKGFRILKVSPLNNLVGLLGGMVLSTAWKFLGIYGQ